MPEIKDYTPAHRKCAVSMACPSIHKLEDERWLVVGAAGYMEAKNFGVSRSLTEEAVILPSDLLDEIKAEAIRPLQTALCDIIWGERDGDGKLIRHWTLEEVRSIAEDALSSLPTGGSE